MDVSVSAVECLAGIEFEVVCMKVKSEIELVEV
jgi:hypothetical protein